VILNKACDFEKTKFKLFLEETGAMNNKDNVVIEELTPCLKGIIWQYTGMKGIYSM